MQTPACLLHTLFRRCRLICWEGADEVHPLALHRAQPSSHQDVRNIWNSPSPLLLHTDNSASMGTDTQNQTCGEGHVGCAHPAPANPASFPRELSWDSACFSSGSCPSQETGVFPHHATIYHLGNLLPTLKPSTGRIRKKVCNGGDETFMWFWALPRIIQPQPLPEDFKC